MTYELPGFWQFLIALGAWLFGVGVPLGVLFAVLAYVVSLPLRRSERAWVVLDVLEQGLQSGRTPEECLAGAGSWGNHGLGRKFEGMTALLRQGASLETALQLGPAILPPQVVALLKVGRETGELPRLLPLCRRMLGDALSRTRSALNYLPILGLVLIPTQVIVFFMLQIWIWPRLVEIAKDMEIRLPAFSLFALATGSWLVPTLLVLVLFFWWGLILYLAGPGFLSSLGLKTWRDRTVYLLPWRKRRLRRDFAGVLSLLLDAEVPEGKAVQLAAESTANDVLVGQARRVVESLESGRRLPEALRRLDDAGEFQWRLASAAQRGKGFWEALAGWQEALDAKAFQQEQAAAQVLTAGFVLLNGAVVGMMVTSVFLVLIRIIDSGLLW